MQRKDKNENEEQKLKEINQKSNKGRTQNLRERDPWKREPKNKGMKMRQWY